MIRLPSTRLILRLSFLLYLVYTTMTLLPVQASERQSPYELRLETDLLLGTAGLGFIIPATLLRFNTAPLRESELAVFRASEVNDFDRAATANYSTAAGTVSDILMISSLSLPLALLANASIRDDYLSIGIMALEVLTITEGVTGMSKTLSLRARPFVYNANAPLQEKLSPDARLSFFSGHTSQAAAFSFFAAKVISDYHPDSKLKPLIWAAAVTIPALTGYMRFKAGRHFSSDVIAGYAVGALAGYFVPYLHQRGSPRRSIVLVPKVGQQSIGLGLEISVY